MIMYSFSINLCGRENAQSGLQHVLLHLHINLQLPRANYVQNEENKEQLSPENLQQVN